MVIAVSTEEGWESLCRTLGLDALAADPRFATNELRVQNRDALIAELDKTTGAMGRYDLENKLCAAGVPAGADAAGV